MLSIIIDNVSVQFSCSVVSDSLRPHESQPTRLPRPWDSPGKNTRVGCHFLIQCMKVKSESEVIQSCPTLHLESGFSSVQFSRSVVSDSLRPHESQHARPPCPSPTPRVHSNSCPSNRWCHPSHPLSSPSPPAPIPSQHQDLFQWANSSHQVVKVLQFQLCSFLPMNTQD